MRLCLKLSVAAPLEGLETSEMVRQLRARPLLPWAGGHFNQLYSYLSIIPRQESPPRAGRPTQHPFQDPCVLTPNLQLQIAGSFQ